MKSRCAVVFAILMGLAATSLAGAEPTASQIEFFEKSVRPVLVSRCQMCHNAKVKTSGLDLSTAEGFYRGGAGGPLLDPGNWQDSALLQVISYEHKLKMPPTGKLKDEDQASLRAWVQMGAPWPGGEAARAAAAKGTRANGRVITEEERKYWAFQPIKNVAPPAVKNEAWVRTPVDRFILAKLEEKGLQPAPAVDKGTLLRRVTFDLTGLPPTEQEMHAFLSDASPQAYEKVVERLLASPRYGERYGRHWLDVARYADSTGNDEDHRYPYAWRYRDWVINAFNNDYAYPTFVREQIAGDLLPPTDGSAVNTRGIIATGFLALGAKAVAQQDKTKMLYDVYDEQVDVTSKAFLGLTMACARCHDHKFDPIQTKDYYSFVGMFASSKNFSKVPGTVSQLLFRPLVAQEQYEAWKSLHRPIDGKKMEASFIEDREMLRWQKQQATHLARDMVAALGVYRDGQHTADPVVTRLAEYLKPTPETRPHLDAWYHAPTLETALQYQERTLVALELWEKALLDYQAKYLAAVPDAQAKLPSRPMMRKVSEKEDLFFDQVFGGDGPLVLPSKEREKLFEPAQLALAKSLKAEAKRMEAALPPEPPMADAIAEGEPVKQKIFVRGDYNSQGEEAPRAVPTVLAHTANVTFPQDGSGRLQLADWIVGDSNPLTARVMVNRLWLWHFNEGIVRTPDNFGRMGERPTHPELLDYLATEFRSSGWSMKAMHRLMVLSNTYQMSSIAPDAELKADPENKLFTRYQRRRLEVEEMRDAMLAADGSIDLTMGGTLQEGFGTDGENSEKRLSFNPEMSKRRLVYLPLRRANLPALLNLFDFGDATTMSGKRSLTNVAPQALFMMNSEFVSEHAQGLASVTNNNVERAYLRALNRKPRPQEVDEALTYVAKYKSAYGSEQKAWESFCRILLSSNEFMYVD